MWVEDLVSENHFAYSIHVIFELRSSSASSPPPFDPAHTTYTVERPMHWISAPEFQHSVHPGMFKKLDKNVLLG